MGEGGLEAAAVQGGLDQALALEADQCVGAHQSGEDVDAEGLAERDQLQGGHLVVVEAGQALADEVLEAGRRRERADRSPHPGVVDQGPLVDPGQHQLPEVLQVALTGLPELLQGRPFDLALQDELEQLLDLAAVEGADLHPVTEAVLPHRLDGVGGGLAGPDAGHGEDRAGRDQLLEEQGRGVIEPLGVIDEQEEPSSTAALHEGLGGLSQHGDAPLHGQGGRRQDRGEGTEGDAPGRLAGHGPLDVEAGRGAVLGDLGGQAGLAHACRTGEHDTGEVITA